LASPDELMVHFVGVDGCLEHYLYLSCDRRRKESLYTMRHLNDLIILAGELAEQFGLSDVIRLVKAEEKHPLSLDRT
jgi:hypothetical protein